MRTLAQSASMPVASPKPSSRLGPRSSSVGKAELIPRNAAHSSSSISAASSPTSNTSAVSKLKNMFHGAASKQSNGIGTNESVAAAAATAAATGNGTTATKPPKASNPSHKSSSKQLPPKHEDTADAEHNTSTRSNIKTSKRAIHDEKKTLPSSSSKSKPTTTTNSNSNGNGNTNLTSKKYSHSPKNNLKSLQGPFRSPISKKAFNSPKQTSSPLSSDFKRRGSTGSSPIISTPNKSKAKLLSKKNSLTPTTSRKKDPSGRTVKSTSVSKASADTKTNTASKLQGRPPSHDNPLPSLSMANKDDSLDHDNKSMQSLDVSLEVHSKRKDTSDSGVSPKQYGSSPPTRIINDLLSPPKSAKKKNNFSSPKLANGDSSNSDLQMKNQTSRPFKRAASSEPRISDHPHELKKADPIPATGTIVISDDDINLEDRQSGDEGEMNLAPEDDIDEVANSAQRSFSQDITNAISLPLYDDDYEYVSASEVESDLTDDDDDDDSDSEEEDEDDEEDEEDDPNKRRASGVEGFYDLDGDGNQSMEDDVGIEYFLDDMDNDADDDMIEDDGPSRQKTSQSGRRGRSHHRRRTVNSSRSKSKGKLKSPSKYADRNSKDDKKKRKKKKKKKLTKSEKRAKYGGLSLTFDRDKNIIGRNTSGSLHSMAISIADDGSYSDDDTNVKSMGGETLSTEELASEMMKSRPLRRGKRNQRQQQLLQKSQQQSQEEEKPEKRSRSKDRKKEKLKEKKERDKSKGPKRSRRKDKEEANDQDAETKETAGGGAVDDTAAAKKHKYGRSRSKDKSTLVPSKKSSTGGASSRARSRSRGPMDPEKAEKSDRRAPPRSRSAGTLTNFFDKWRTMREQRSQEEIDADEAKEAELPVAPSPMSILLQKSINITQSNNDPADSKRRIRSQSVDDKNWINSKDQPQSSESIDGQPKHQSTRLKRRSISNVLTNSADEQQKVRSQPLSEWNSDSSDVVSDGSLDSSSSHDNLIFEDEDDESEHAHGYLDETKDAGNMHEDHTHLDIDLSPESGEFDFVVNRKPNNDDGQPVDSHQVDAHDDEEQNGDQNEKGDVIDVNGKVPTTSTQGCTASTAASEISYELNNSGNCSFNHQEAQDHQNGAPNIHVSEQTIPELDGTEVISSNSGSSRQEAKPSATRGVSSEKDCETLLHIRMRKIQRKLDELQLKTKHEMKYLKKDFESQKDTLLRRVQGPQDPITTLLGFRKEYIRELTDASKRLEGERKAARKIYLNELAVSTDLSNDMKALQTKLCNQTSIILSATTAINATVDQESRLQERIGILLQVHTLHP